jgi:hypothetical protein
LDQQAEKPVAPRRRGDVQRRIDFDEKRSSSTIVLKTAICECQQASDFRCIRPSLLRPVIFDIFDLMAI